MGRELTDLAFRIQIRVVDSNSATCFKIYPSSSNDHGVIRRSIRLNKRLVAILNAVEGTPVEKFPRTHMLFR